MQHRILSIIKRRWVPLALLLCLACPGPPVFAQSAAPPTGTSQPDFGGPDATANRLAMDRAISDTPIALDFLKPWYAWKDQLRAEHGLEFGLEYNSVYLSGGNRLPNADRNAAGGIFRFRGVWEAFARGTDQPMLVLRQGSSA